MADDYNPPYTSHTAVEVYYWRTENALECWLDRQNHRLHMTDEQIEASLLPLDCGQETGSRKLLSLGCRILNGAGSVIAKEFQGWLQTLKGKFDPSESRHD